MFEQNFSHKFLSTFSSLKNYLEIYLKVDFNNKLCKGKNNSIEVRDIHTKPIERYPNNNFLRFVIKFGE